MATCLDCGFLCKGEWQRSQKPVDRDWLYEKYVVEMKSANEIARIVKRNPKRVWEWLDDYEIQKRPRGYGYATNPAFAFWLHGRESPFKGKRGAAIPSWKGGITPDRQAFYSSLEWKVAVKVVWKRDNATCQRCGKKNSGRERYAFDIHHIVSFSCRLLRSEVSNLVLLCEECHYWIHSTENTLRLFLAEEIRNVVA